MIKFKLVGITESRSHEVYDHGFMLEPLPPGVSQILLYTCKVEEGWTSRWDVQYDPNTGWFDGHCCGDRDHYIAKEDFLSLLGKSQSKFKLTQIEFCTYS